MTLLWQITGPVQRNAFMGTAFIYEFNYSCIFIVCFSVRIWGEPVDFFNHAEHSLKQASIPDIPLHDIIDVIGGYVGKCYADSWPELRQLSLEVAKSTGVFVDRVYTAKAILATKHELMTNPQRFKGDNILFIHTGGIYGFIDGSMTDEIQQTNPITELASVLDCN